jgi:hypothetical protein
LTRVASSGKCSAVCTHEDRTEGFIPGLQCFAWLNPRVDRRSSPMQPAWQGFVFGCRELDRHCSQRTSKPAILILGVINSDRHGQLKITFERTVSEFRHWAILSTCSYG